MLQCTTRLSVRGGCLRAELDDAGGVTVYVCVARTSTFSGNADTRSMNVRSFSMLPLTPGPNSGFFVVYSGVTSITAALSGPHALISKLATIGGCVAFSTARKIGDALSATIVYDGLSNRMRSPRRCHRT